MTFQKPSDHPEYFRLPLPEGRSRESTIVLNSDGRFVHEGEPVVHPGMRRAFASWLSRHPDDGRFILDNGYDWTYLTVEGASAFVENVRAAPDGSPELVLFDGTVAALAPAQVWVDENERLHAHLSGGKEADFMPAAQLALAPWLEERSGVPGLEIAGKFWPIARAGARP